MRIVILTQGPLNNNISRYLSWRYMPNMSGGGGTRLRVNTTDCGEDLVPFIYAPPSSNAKYDGHEFKCLITQARHMYSTQ